LGAHFLSQFNALTCQRFNVLLAALCVTPFLIPISAAQQNDLLLTEIKLPPLRIQGQPGKAHTQGLELGSTNFYVTARRDDLLPKRALLLRTAPGRPDWDVWDITPVDAQGNLTSLDHPGGMQSDGKHFWIPLAESKRHGRSLVRRYPIDSLVPGQPPKPDFEFEVHDHIGAVAVSNQRKLLFGANWDTESVYVWDFTGHLQQTFTSAELGRRGIGVGAAGDSNAPDRPTGLTVQDWKWVDDRLFASGLFRAAKTDPNSPQSQIVSFVNVLEPRFQRIAIPLPKQHGTELAREGMAISDGTVYFLPEDLTSTNRIFRMPLQDLLKLEKSAGRN